MKQIKENNSNKKRLIEGIVSSDKMDKTIVVDVNEMKVHPKYLKRYVSTKRYKAHDPDNKFKVGEKVKISETKPISKDKKWKVIY